jgi:DNA polymerase-3 subunit alpha
MDVRAFPDRLDNGKELLKDDNIVILECIIDIDEEQEKISATALSISAISHHIEEEIQGIRIRITKDKIANGLLEKIKEVLIRNKGNKKVILAIYDGKKSHRDIVLHPDFYVDYNDKFKQEILSLISEKEIEVY